MLIFARVVGIKRATETKSLVLAYQEGHLNEDFGVDLSCMHKDGPASTADQTYFRRSPYVAAVGNPFGGEVFSWL